MGKTKPASTAPDVPANGGVAMRAQICHEANRAFCQYLGDDTQLPWDYAPDWQRESAINGVEFHLANPDAGDAASHDNWMAVKLADGWTYGAVKDETAKTHPCLVPFDQLPPDQQFKDKLFRTIVHAAVLPTDLVDHAVDATAGELSALKRVAELEAELEAAHQEHAKVDVKLKVAHKPKPKSAKSRKIGALVTAKDEAKRADQKVALGQVVEDAMQDGENSLELVFSDGDKEIIAIEPIGLWPAAFRKGAGGRYHLVDAVLLKGSEPGLVLGGVGLVDAGGTQIGWCPMLEPIEIPLGGEVKLDRMIWF